MRIFNKHEVHCTIDSSDHLAVAAFKKECEQGGIKVIIVENGATKVSTHVMTSTVCHSRRSASLLITELREIACLTNTSLIREKIEIPPVKGDRVSGQNYFELHVNVCVPDLARLDFDRTKWFVSQNINKRSNDGLPIHMLTARSYNISLEEFLKSCHKSMTSFETAIYKEDPIFTEKCIHDSNPCLDEHWMRPGV